MTCGHDERFSGFGNPLLWNNEDRGTFLVWEQKDDQVHSNERHGTLLVLEQDYKVHSHECHGILQALE